MSKIAIRTNGCGNAWPSFLGQEHPFYDVKKSEDMANASFSVFGYKEKLTKENIDWSVLIDAGHGAIQQLLKNENRIPEAIFLTHPHHDHTFSLDWVVQSKYRTGGGRYPVYCTEACYKFVLQSYPHLKDLIEYYPLEFGKEQKVSQVDGMTIKAFPAYHGPSALGASILKIEIDSRKLIFTGDILFPMVQKKDLVELTNADVLYVDTNNRYSDPNTNHWSVVSNQPEEKERSIILNKWLSDFDIQDLAIPHKIDTVIPPYISTFLNEQSEYELVSSILDFVQIIHPKNVGFVHYSGAQDAIHYKKDILDAEALCEWIESEKNFRELKFNTVVPKAGDLFVLN